MKAIILAAGYGRRLQGFSNSLPKPLLEIRGKSLLEHSLDAISTAGIRQADVVVGYKKEMIKRKLGGSCRGVDLNYPEDSRIIGSMHSLLCALQEPQDSIVLDGDIIYEPSILSTLINHQERNLVALSGLSGSGDEVYVSLDSSGRVISLSKNKPSKPPFYEFTGISKFSKEFLKAMAHTYNSEVSRGNSNDYWEDCAARTSALIPWMALIQENLIWAEIDCQEHYKRAVEKILPKLCL